jgi:hypothetical protein
VVADLLSSTDFNYVIAASPSDPQTILTLLLSPRPNDSPTEVAANGNVPPNWRAWLEAQENPAQSASPPRDEYAQKSAPASPAPVETATAPAVSVPLEAVPADPASVAFATLPPALTDAPRASTAESQAKNTEQMISDMMRMYDQRKQMVQLEALTVQ